MRVSGSSGDFADRMYARIVPSAQNAERVIQTFVSRFLTGAVHRQRVGREAVRQCKAADALHSVSAPSAR